MATIAIPTPALTDIFFFFLYIFRFFLCICTSAAPQRPAHGTVSSQVATHLRTDRVCRVLGRSWIRTQENWDISCNFWKTASETLVHYFSHHHWKREEHHFQPIKNKEKVQTRFWLVQEAGKYWREESANFKAVCIDTSRILNLNVDCLRTSQPKLG